MSGIKCRRCGGMHFTKDCTEQETSENSAKTVGPTAPPKGPTNLSKDIPLPNSNCIGLVVGKRGAHIQKLQTDYKCHISINHDTCSVHVTGAPHNVQGVEEWVNDIVAKYSAKLAVQKPATAESAPATD
eukprot:NODE_6972_length_481_cov_10.522599_g6806_i0.p2 GENE.NODE_6972_length_481_cov_10.522599_g6806_i0~~NODE_6972_length_481_cov_10.522599_g6806_i0.p2  ORF type:complete len:142 (-),score=37.24 NODE_6972_length_481_cov_10.522599_g6806_i0:56-442(-)